jgi:hypothetical protein
VVLVVNEAGFGALSYERFDKIASGIGECLGSVEDILSIVRRAEV